MIIWCRQCHEPMEYGTPASCLLAMPAAERITCGTCSIKTCQSCGIATCRRDHLPWCDGILPDLELGWYAALADQRITQAPPPPEVGCLICGATYTGTNYVAWLRNHPNRCQSQRRTNWHLRTAERVGMDAMNAAIRGY